MMVVVTTIVTLLLAWLGRGAVADAAKKRTEVLWINRAAEQLRLL